MNKKISTHKNRISSILLRHIEANPGVSIDTLKQIMGVDHTTYSEHAIYNYFINPLELKGLVFANFGQLFPNQKNIDKARAAARASLPENHGKRWTEADTIKVCELWYNRDPWYYIAEQLGRTQSACQFRLHHIKMACELLPLVDANEIIREMVAA